MAEEGFAVESGQSTAYTVFIDTSIDTHLAMIVSDEDTVRDLKQKIMIEHPRCFPSVGEIIIHALKVRRKAFFYHLSDSMHVKSAFDGVNRSWFIYADAASSQLGHIGNQLHLEPGFGAKKTSDSEVLKNHDLVSEGNEVPGTHTGYKKGKSKKRPCDDKFGETLKKHKNEKKIEEAFSCPVKDPFNEGDSRTFVSSKERTQPEKKIFPENTLEDNEKIGNVASDGLLSKLLDDGHSLQSGLDNGKKEKKNKNKPSSLCEEVDSVVLPFGENIRREGSKEASENNHKELGTDAAIDPDRTSVLEKEKHCSPVHEVGEDNLRLYSSSDRPHVLAEKASVVDTDTLVAMDVGESGGSKMDSRMDALRKPMASGRKKAKNSTKHRASSPKDLTVPLVEKSDTLTRAIPPSIYEDGGLGDEDIDIGITGKIGKEEKPLPQNGDHIVMSLEANDSESKLLGEDEGGMNIKAGVDSGVMEARDLSYKSKKKSKKTKSSDAKKTCVLSSSIEHTNSVGDVVPLRLELDKAFDSDHNGDEKNVVSGKTKLSEIEDAGPANDNFGPDLTNKTEKMEKILMSSDATTSKYKSLGQDEPEMNIKDGVGSSNLLDASGIIEAGEPSVKRKKKSKKAKASHANSHVLSSGVEQSKSDHPGDEINNECDTLKLTEKREISKIQDAGPCDGNFGTDLSDKTEKEEKAFKQDEDKKMIPTEAINSKCKSLGQDEAEVYIKDVRLSGDKKRKKSKKSNASDAKGRVLSSDLEHVQDVGVVFPLRSDPEKAFCVDHRGDETNKEDNISSRTENIKVSKIECGGPADENFGMGLTDKIEKEEKALPQNEDPKMLLSEATDSKDKSFIGYEAEMNVKDRVVASSTIEARDPSHKRRKKSKKTKASHTKSHVPEHADDSAGDIVPLRSDHDKSLDSDRPGGDTNREEDNILSQTEETKESKIKSLNAPLPGFDKKDDQQRITQVTRVEETTNYSEDKDRDLTPPTDELKAEQNPPSKKMKKSKSKSRKRSSINHLTDSTMEAGKEYQISGDVEKPQIPSDTVECNVQGSPLVNSRTDEANNDIEIPNVDREVNFIDYFLPKQDDQEIVTPTKETKANKKSKKVQGGVSDKSPLQVPLSKNEQSRQASQPNGKASIIAGDSVKAPTSNDHDKIDAFPSKVSSTKTVDSSGTISPVHAPPVRSLFNANANTPSSSSMESSENGVYENKRHGERQLQSNRRRVTVSKSYSKKKGKVLNNSNNEKSLLATANTIFKDSSTESSEDEGGVNNSDASTRSPSHNSSSSDYSEGVHEAIMESPENGPYVRKRVENGGNNTPKSQSVGPKNMTLDMIFRSSKSYKKAKLTASQSQLDDTESQPIDFVLDSQA